MSTASSTNPASSSALLQLSGLASGINWQTLVNQLSAAESAPITGMQAQEANFQSQSSAYQTIGTDLDYFKFGHYHPDGPRFLHRAHSLDFRFLHLQARNRGPPASSLGQLYF